MRFSIQYGSVLLALSALVSKGLGLYRDRLFLTLFESPETVDLIFASFRIPDFFFFLLIAGTVSTLLIPRVHNLEKTEKTLFVSSFFWGILVFFGAICALGVVFTPFFIRIFAGGFESSLQSQMIPLSRFLFGSVFILSISSVFAAFHQYKKQFAILALAPVLYTATLCGGLLLFQTQYGLTTVGISALCGALFHAFINIGLYVYNGEKIKLCWKKPSSSWQSFRKDFLFRVLNNSGFQINQSIDILIASFLMMGSVTAFSLGTNTGMVLLSIVGLPIANATFPYLTDASSDTEKQRKIVIQTLKQVLIIAIPASLIGIFIGKPLLAWAYNIENIMLTQTYTVFFWTVLSLPFACMIPTLSRVFLANNDTKTPLIVTSLSLAAATLVVLISVFIILPEERAILGLALGNLTANTLSALLFISLIFRSPRRT